MLMPILGSNEKKRRESILRVASRDLEIGFLLAVFNFEWTLRRMILCFSKCPSIVIRALLAKTSGFWKYCEVWDMCVHEFDNEIGTMTEILGIPPKAETKQNCITEFLDSRHVLVHGATSGIGAATALCGIKKLLGVSEGMASYSRKKGQDLFRMVNPRQQVRCGFIGNRGTRKFEKGQNCAACPGEIIGFCPFLNKKENRRDIRDYLDARLSIIQESKRQKETKGQKGEALVLKIQEVANELGIAEKPSVKRAVRELQTAIQKRNRLGVTRKKGESRKGDVR